MTLSLRAKIIFIAVAILLFGIGANTLINGYIFTSEYSKTLQSKARIIGRILKFQLERLLALEIPIENLVGFGEQCQEVVNRYEEISYAMVVDVDGKILFHNESSKQNKALSNAEMLEAIKSVKGSFQVHQKLANDHHNIFLPVHNTHGIYSGVVIVGFPKRIIAQKTAKSVFYSAVVACAAFILAISLLFLTLSIWVTKPITKLMNAVQAIGRKGTSLHKKIEVASRDEIGELASIFNRMTEDLQKTTVSKEYVDNIIGSMLDALVVVDPDLKIRTVNKATCELLGYGEQELIGEPVETILAKETPLKTKELHKLIMEARLTNHEMDFKTKDGRKIPVLFNSSTMKDRDGNLVSVVSTVRDITEHKRAERALQREKQALQRLAEEREVIAKIGRITSSTLEIDKVYERFAEEVRKLISFDEMAISIIHPERDSLVIPYATGVVVEGRRPDDVVPLAGSLTEEVMRKRAGQLIQTENGDEITARFPGLMPFVQAGFRSFMAVPLISRDHVIGVLHGYSAKPKAYTEADVRLVENIGMQIAGAIANAQLYEETKRAEARLQRQRDYLDALQETSLGMINRLDLNQLLEAIIERATSLIGAPNGFIHLLEPGGAELEVKAGVGVHKEHVGFRQKFDQGLSGRVLQTGQAIVADDYRSWSGGIQDVRFEAVRSAVGIPLKSGEQIMGAIGAYDSEEGKYGDEEVEILSRFAALASIALDNARLYTNVERELAERKRTESALQREKRAVQRLAEEKEIVAEIGRIIGSTMEIDKVYERFAEEVRKLIPFDRISINIVRPKRGTFTTAYMAGHQVPDREPGDTAPLAGSLTEGVMRSRTSEILQTEHTRKVVARFPGLLSTFQVGLRSLIAVPLISKDEVIGVLHVQSAKPKAYTEADVKLAESIGSQIAGAIANAKLYAEQKRAEERVENTNRKLLREMKDKEEFLRIVSHDLGAPVRNISGMATSVLRKYGEDVDDDVKDRLTRIQRNAEQELDLIQDLLELSRIKTRRERYEEVDLGELVRGVGDGLSHQMEEKGITLKVAEGFPAVFCERKRMVQVFQNLIDNACKYMDGNGDPRIDVGFEELGDSYRFFVSDNGIGIRKEDQESIFYVFNRLRNPVTGKVGGKGIGLSAVKSIVENYGGEAWVESPPKGSGNGKRAKGSTFYFTLAKGALEEGRQTNEKEVPWKG